MPTKARKLPSYRLCNPTAQAVVGLGVGTPSCYAEPGQHWTYYEIDPAVVRSTEGLLFKHEEDARKAQGKIAGLIASSR